MCSNTFLETTLRVQYWIYLVNVFNKGCFYNFLFIFFHTMFEITIFSFGAVSICETTDPLLPLAERIHVPSPKRGLGLLRLTFGLFNYFTFLYTLTTQLD